MRILHVTQPVDGGVAAYVRAACVDQLARGWQVAVACPDGGRLAGTLARAGVARLRWDATRNPGRGSLAEARRLAGIVAAYRPDVVHLHASKAGLAGRLAAHVARRAADPGRLPTVFQPHGWSWLAVNGTLRTASVVWERAASRWTDLFVCVGAAEAEAGRERRVAGRYTVVRNGVDRGRYPVAAGPARAAARQLLGLDPSAPLAVCVGRVTRQKGQDLLLAGWPAVRAGCPDARLAVVGDGDLLPALRADTPAGVTFAGATADVRPWLAAADVVVLPSRWEGLPLTVLEAFATGRPVVATRIPGLAEVVPERVGALVRPDDPAALAAALVARLTDPRRCRREGAAAADHADRFDQRRTFDALAVATLSTVDNDRRRTGRWSTMDAKVAVP